MLYSLLIDAQRPGYSTEQRQIDSLLRTFYRNDEPGASIAVLKNGRLFKYNYGLMDLDSREKIRSTTHFNIGSITKQFTATAILQLVEQKKLALDDKIGNFFPGLNKKIGQAVSVRQLLTHSSDIIDHYDYADKNLKHAHDSDVLAAISNIDSTYFPPGTAYRYSNAAYCLLALIIEKLSGSSYSDYLTKNIFQPLKMSKTIIWNENKKLLPIATGYEYDTASTGFKKSGPDENVFFSTEGDGGIYTSIDDYLKWFEGLQSAKIISETSVRKARSSQFPINRASHLNYGYGWFIDESSDPVKVYHSGSNGGFRTFSFSIPSQNILIVVFSNRTGIDLEKLVLEINKILRFSS